MSPGLAHESILVVDDQPLSIKLMQLILEGEGYHVLVAANATEALQAVRDSKPDLILMDIHLPSLDGLALTKLLRSDEETRTSRSLLCPHMPRRKMISELPPPVALVSFPSPSTPERLPLPFGSIWTNSQLNPR